jgi:hypothetical protein
MISECVSRESIRLLLVGMIVNGNEACSRSLTCLHTAGNRLYCSSVLCEQQHFYPVQTIVRPYRGTYILYILQYVRFPVGKRKIGTDNLGHSS